MVTDKELYEVLCLFLDSSGEGITDSSSESASDVEESATNLSGNKISTPRREIVHKAEQLKKALAKKKYSKPRMVSTDIRESYGAMFANTWNTCDLSIISKMCHEYYMPNMTVTVRKQINLDPDLFITKGVGPRFVANLLYSASVLSPDITNKLKHASYKASSNGFGEVSFIFYYYGSKVYNVPSILEVLPELVVGKEQAEAQGLTPSPMLTDEVIEQCLERIKSSLPLRRRPVKVVCKCVVKMITNPQKKVEAIMMSVYNEQNDFNVEAV